MRPSDYQVQFKDIFFIHKLTHPQSSSHVCLSQTKKTLCRSMWTNKIKRRKMIGLKLGPNEVIFRKPFLEEDKQVSLNSKTLTTNRPISLTNHHHLNQLSCRKIISASSSQRNSVKAESHFFISRNYSPMTGDQSKEKEKILKYSVQNQGEKENEQREGDARCLLKNLRIKNNINIYKGNFTKFTKKIVNKTEELKKKHIAYDSSLSPWEVNDKSTHFL